MDEASCWAAVKTRIHIEDSQNPWVVLEGQRWQPLQLLQAFIQIELKGSTGPYPSILYDIF